jgi:hypothetical protein
LFLVAALYDCFWPLVGESKNAAASTTAKANEEIASSSMSLNEDETANESKNTKLSPNPTRFLGRSVLAP